MNALVRVSLVRLVMVGTWVFVVAAILLLPRFLQLLYTDESRSINLYVWPMMIDSKKLIDFQKETGIKVYMHYYESNEELLQKLYVTGGKGYDLVVPVDYVVDLLRKKELLQKIDHTKLNFWYRLRPSLLHYYHDIGNEYSIPYFLSVYGLGIDPDYFGGKQPLPSWKLLFERQPEGYDVAITDVPRRALAIASYYLFGDEQAIADPEKRTAVEQLLIKQKEWVRMYTDIRGEDLLATKNCPVVMTIASDLWMIKREYPHLLFKIPQEGTFITIDSFVIPKASNKQDLVYEFLNYLYRPEIVAYHATRYGFCPPVEDADITGSGIFCPTSEQLSKFHFFKNSIPESLVNDLWVSIIAH
ncbi:spermidine/putrescine ABC transporter substrate-binding protein [Candidatus Dependentiae bacterium]|nr:spermidine/putrescine ABC transporter substrate-binding protein [Candidatus Dependentiae bacterium]